MLETKADFARRCGVARATVTNWVKDGIIRGPGIVGIGRSARINPKVAQGQIKSRRDPSQALGNGRKTQVKPAKKAAPIVGDDEDLDYATEKARLAKEQADNWATRNAVARGALLSADDVQRTWNNILAGLRSALLRLPSRVKDAAPHLTATDIAAVDTELRLVLKELSDGRFDT